MERCSQGVRAWFPNDADALGPHLPGKQGHRGDDAPRPSAGSYRVPDEVVRGLQIWIEVKHESDGVCQEDLPQLQGDQA